MSHCGSQTAIIFTPTHFCLSLFLSPSLSLSPRAWIQELSTYAISSLLRAAKLGREIKESWVVENAATHLWNYSPQLLAAGQNEQLLPALQTMVELLLKTDCHG